MNEIIILARLTADPEIRSTADGKTIANYSLAENRDREHTNFFRCVAFGKAAEFAEKYLKKGNLILVTGRVQTGSYTNRDGVKIPTFDVVVTTQNFAEKKTEAPQAEAPQTTPEKVADGWVNMPENIDDLPFR